MIKLTRLADYAVLLMSCLARRPGDLHNAADLAQESHLPAPTVSKILGTMARAGLLVSHRGHTGGFSLARRPDEISVAAIVRLFDGPLALTECIDPDTGECEIESTCSVRGYWQKINNAVERAMSDVTLADLACPVMADPLAGAAKPPAGSALH
jgi:FeS assembly SUF system regulator